MTDVQLESKALPLPPKLVHRVADLLIKAEAMGLIRDLGTLGQLNSSLLREGLGRISDAGIATGLVAGLAATLAGPAGLEDPDVAGALDAILEALERSPLPDHEWRPMIGLFGVEMLAGLLCISPSSLHRYSKAARPTPDSVADRLHFVALVAGDLKGAYNDIGIRRWWQRRRALLDDRAPAELLKGQWSSDEPGPHRVRGLARSLVWSGAT